jgi:hypothetical protein
MLKMKPTFIEENGKAKFVVFSIRDYATIKEALEDADDARILDEAKRRGAGKPRIPHKQILEEFGLSHLLRAGDRTGANKPGIASDGAKRPLGPRRKGRSRKRS